MRLYEKELSREEKFKGRILELHVDKVELENGKESIREIIEHPGGVCVAAITEEDELMFVRQFRYPYKEIVLELPAGKLEKGEDPAEAVKRELAEETGCEGKDYRFLGKTYPSPGYTSEIIWLWCCRIANTGEMNPDEDEFIEVEKIYYKTAVRMVLNNEIPDAKTQLGILKAAAFIEGRLEARDDF